VDENYFNLYEVPLLAGRNFTNESMFNGEIIINVNSIDNFRVINSHGLTAVEKNEAKTARHIVSKLRSNALGAQRDALSYAPELNFVKNLIKPRRNIWAATNPRPKGRGY
jgi:hypothetical protein